MEKIWEVKTVSESDVQKVINLLGCRRVTAQIIAGRGYTEDDNIRSFIMPSFTAFKDPNSIKDMDKASKRVFKALEKKEHIMIYGDYDADGLTSTTILFEFLRDCDADVSYYIPHRKKDGYGLKSEFVESCSSDLIITVDNGISSFDAVDNANSKGIDVIVIDHHDVSDRIPDASAVVNPKRDDCSSSMGYLAGVGVTYCFLIVMRQFLRKAGFYENRKEPNLKEYCDLVAIGTIADLVPLVSENRVLVKTGFEVIERLKRPGLRSLIRHCNLNGKLGGSDDIAFKIAPKINAAGRIENGDICVELFTTEDKERADAISKKLLSYNDERKSIELSTEKEIIEKIDNSKIHKEKDVIVLSSGEWDSGVLGIVASKIVSKYYKPVILFEENGKMSKGSGRSIKGINIYEGLKYADKYISNYGGHELAAGLSIETGKISLFEELFDQYAKKVLGKEKLFPVLSIDCTVPLNEIDETLMSELEKIEPCGMENRSPLFKADDIEIVSVKTVGGIHRKIVLKQKNMNGNAFQCILFNRKDFDNSIKYFESMLFSLKWNIWNGSRSIQIIIEDYR